MIENGISVGTSTYNIVLNGLCKNNSSDEAITLFKKLQAMNVKIDIITVNIMINIMFKTRRIEGAKELFASIPASGLVPSVETYCLMMTNLIKQGLPEEAGDIFSSMENASFDPDSRLLNHVVRALLGKHEIVGAGTYLSKIDERNFLLEDSTIMAFIDFFSSKGICQEHMRFLPEKYHIVAEDDAS
jgi:pentatricopeptide repeat protein